ncbi:MAG: TonB-dependent receptor, partial [Bacteroidia bacterium]|nr:TonB-dependent receptor [Bacteroidia bacterium]
PSRDDYTQSSEFSRPKAEELNDIEFGFTYSKPKFVLSTNFYFMDYTNQLVLTGEVNDVGAYTRTNIENSFRAGVELQTAYRAHEKIRLEANLTLSRSEIEALTEYIDDYTLGVQLNRQYENTSIAFSPDIIGALNINYEPIERLTLQSITKYVGEQYLDNTSDPTKALDAYTTTDVIVSYKIEPKWIKGITIRAAFNNILDLNYASNGYTFSYADDGVVSSENWVYPQAGFNVLGQITLDF